jgi:hypothetical protein
MRIDDHILIVLAGAGICEAEIVYHRLHDLWYTLGHTLVDDAGAISLPKYLIELIGSGRSYDACGTLTGI